MGVGNTHTEERLSWFLNLLISTVYFVLISFGYIGETLKIMRGKPSGIKPPKVCNTSPTLCYVLENYNSLYFSISLYVLTLCKAFYCNHLCI